MSKINNLVLSAFFAFGLLTSSVLATEEQEDSRAVLQSIIESLPQTEQENLKRIVTPLAEKVEEWDRAKLLKIVMDTATAEREELGELLDQYLSGCAEEPTMSEMMDPANMSGYMGEFMRDLDAVTKPFMSKPDPEKVAKLNMMHKMISGGSGFIISAFEKLPSEQKVSVAKMVLPIIEGKQDARYRGIVLWAIADLPEDDRENIVDSSQPFLADIYDDNWAKGIIRAITSIPTEERADICRRAMVKVLELDGDSKDDGDEIMSIIKNAMTGQNE